MYTADLQTSRLFFLNSIQMFLAANVWCGTMSAYHPAPSPSNRDDKQQQAEDTGHVYKEMEPKSYVCNNPNCRKTFTKFAYEIDLAEPNRRFESCPPLPHAFFLRIRGSWLISHCTRKPNW